MKEVFDKLWPIVLPIATALLGGAAGNQSASTTMQDSCTQAISIIIQQNGEAAKAKLLLCEKTKGKVCK